MGKNILITAGPTQEALDPVRFLTNHSSGKMGFAMAAAAAQRGHAVTLITGPVALATPPKVARRIDVVSAADMAAAVAEWAPSADVVIMAAAVADYRPKAVAAEKIKKQEGPLTIELERTEDILARLGRERRPGQLLIGFAAETGELLARAADKLVKKNLDWVIANLVGEPDRGFASDTNAVTLIARDGRHIDMETAPKRELAEKLLNCFEL